MILNKTLIFARMLPEHKILLIESIKNLKYTIAMCGDGANDIGALRTADIGISLGLDEMVISVSYKRPLLTSQDKVLLKLEFNMISYIPGEFVLYLDRQ